MRRQATTLLLAILVLVSGPAAAGRLVAVGDVHGEIDGFKSVLEATGLIDDEGRWSGGETVLVQTGDLLDRGTQVRAVLDLMMALERQAPKQGGRVVTLLGNHEINSLSRYFDTFATPVEVFHEIWSTFADSGSEDRQLRAYKRWQRWHRRYPNCGQALSQEEWMALYPPGYVEYQEAFSPKGRYGRWLRSLPVAAELGGTIFLHGGLSPELLARGLDSVDKLNAAARKEIDRFDADWRRLVHYQAIAPFSTLEEAFCAINTEVGYLVAAEDLTQEAVRRIQRLRKIGLRLPSSPNWLLTHDDGPLWYRGLAIGSEEERAETVGEILGAFGARRVVVGHTPLPGKIRSRFDGRVILIDTAMAYADVGGDAAALELNGDSATVIYADRREPLSAEAELLAAATERADPNRKPPAAVESTNGDSQEPPPAVEGTNGHPQEPPPAVDTSGGQAQEPPAAAEGSGEEGSGRRLWLDPDGDPLPFGSDDEILEFLSTAKIVDRREVGSGVTKPDLLTLERGGVRARAIFHDINVEKTRQRLAGGEVVMFFRDNYKNNVAAYQLSRLLELDKVPPVVVRKVERTEGSVQMWIEGANDEIKRRERNITPPGYWRLAWDDMRIFDNLINNIDRNQGNILWDSEWKLWFIDHTRAFGRDKKPPRPEKIKRCSRRLWRVFSSIDDDVIRQNLKPYLGTYEIAAVLARRKALVKLIEKRIAEEGEDKVLRSYDDYAGVVQIEYEELDVPPPPPGR